MDILTGDGTIVTVTSAPDDPNRDLYLSFPEPYGSLGHALRLRLKIQPAGSGLRQFSWDSAKELALSRSPKARAITAYTCDLFTDGVFRR